jgi:hypothetical protein
MLEIKARFRSCILQQQEIKFLALLMKIQKALSSSKSNFISDSPVQLFLWAWKHLVGNKLMVENL